LKLVVYGCNGQLAQCIITNKNIVEQFSEIEYVSWQQFLDDCLPTICRKTVVIDTFANTNVDYAETYPNSVIQSHLISHMKLLDISKKAKRYVYISSTGVYGDTKSSPHTEIDCVSPTTVHHMTKYLAEKQVIDKFSDRALILRIGWLFSLLQLRKNFVSARITDLMLAKSSNFKLNVFQNQIGNPTFGPDMVDAMFDLLKTDASGVINVVNPAPISRAKFIFEIAKLVNADKYVNFLPPEERPQRIAKVADNETADGSLIKSILGHEMPHWNIGLGQAVRALHEKN